MKKADIFSLYAIFPATFRWRYRYILNCFMKYFISERCLYILVSAVLFLSCKKNSSSPVDPPPSPYFIKATIDGVDYDFKDFTGAATNSQGQLTLYAADSDYVGYPDEITLYLNHNQASAVITPGVYTDTSNVYTFDLQLLQSGINYRNSNEFDVANSNPVVCTISYIDSVLLSGTFSGIVYYYPTSTIYKTITNGSFTVPF